MAYPIHVLEFNGALLSKGFWLYVYEVIPPHGTVIYYVGRTGDSSSPNTQSPFNRMGQHLSSNNNSNMLRRHLKEKAIDPEECVFRLVAHGPILEEAETTEIHRERRDVVAALEKALAEAMKNAGYNVINTVSSTKLLDERRFYQTLVAFAAEFPKLLEGKK